MMRAWALAVLCAGCAETSFSSHSRDNNVEDIKRALSLSVPGALASDRHMAFLVTTAPDRQLVGYDLATRQILWREKCDIRSRVVASAGLIVHRQGESELVARDPKSGAVRFSLRLGAQDKYVGAALDEERLYYVVQSSAGAQRASFTIAVDHAGRELWRVPATGSIGAPAARGGVVAVPYHYQNVTLLDGKTGRELARVRNKDEQITFVRALPEGFFYGGSSAKGVYLLDPRSASGTRAESAYVEAQLGSDQVRTFYYWDGYQLAQTDYTAFDRNRLLWRGALRSGKLAFGGDAAVLHSYRYLFAFDAGSGKLRWAYAHPRVDLVSAEAAGSEILFASVDGDIGTLDEKTGALHKTTKTGLRLAGVTFDAEGFRGERGTAESQPDLLKTLSQIVWDPDARFNAVKVFAAAAMGEIPGTEASQALLKLVLAQRGVAQAVQKKAGEELVRRKDAGAVPHYLEALKVRYDFVEDKQAFGVDVLARAAAVLDAKDAAPLLAAHLVDPATPMGALKEIAAALAGLGGKDAARGLRDFLLTYRADPSFLAEPSALTIAGEGLAKSGPEGMRTVAFVAEERRTLQPVAKYLQKLLEGSAPKKK